MKKALSLTLASLGLLALTSSAFAAEANNASIVVTKNTCSKMANTTNPFILVLNTGDEIMESISQCAKDAKLSGATISGLGQLHNPTLAYFTGKQGDKPTLTAFPGHYELASMNGNIATSDENYYTH